MIPKRTACILVVDDEPSIRTFLRMLLMDEGYRVETAMDGLDALQQLGSAPDLVLLDLQMPVMNGYEFLGHFRNTTKHGSTPVLVVTSNDDGKAIEGAQAILRKPFEITALLAQVSALLGVLT